MREEKFYCDLCKKEVWDANSVTIWVLAKQGPEAPSHFNKDDFENRAWKYRTDESIVACSECLGEKLTHCFGDTPPLAVENGFTKLLKKLKFLKP